MYAHSGHIRRLGDFKRSSQSTLICTLQSISRCRHCLYYRKPQRLLILANPFACLSITHSLNVAFTPPDTFEVPYTSARYISAFGAILGKQVSTLFMYISCGVHVSELDGYRSMSTLACYMCQCYTSIQYLALLLLICLCEATKNYNWRCSDLKAWSFQCSPLERD